MVCHHLFVYWQLCTLYSYKWTIWFMSKSTQNYIHKPVWFVLGNEILCPFKEWILQCSTTYKFWFWSLPRCVSGYDVVYSKTGINYTSILTQFEPLVSASTSYVYMPQTKQGSFSIPLAWVNTEATNTFIWMKTILITIFILLKLLFHTRFRSKKNNTIFTGIYE